MRSGSEAPAGFVVQLTMPESILVRGVNWIGDAVMTMPALKALRKAFPGSSISLLVKPPVAALFEADPSVDEVILYGERFRGIAGRCRLALELRKKRFSRAILFQNAFDAAFISFLSGVPERIGYDRDGRGFLLTKRIPFEGDDRRVHHIEYYLNLLRAAGVPVPDAASLTGARLLAPWIHLSLPERLSARAALAGLSRPVLGINPGAAYGSAKRWFPERFAEVAAWFIRDTGGSVAVFGGQGERAAAEEICRMVGMRTEDEGRDGTRILDLSGRTSLRELAGLISESDVFLTNDSGPMHVAYAVGTPLVAVFGSTSPALTGYKGDGAVTIHHGFECGPCFKRSCGVGDMRCLYAVTADEVYLAVKGLLPRQRAVFFDRDGTLCRDASYLNRWSDFSPSPGLESLAVLRERGFSLIGVSNQSGIARGLVDESFAQEVNRFFIDRHGFSDFYYCPHHPDDHCPCRKPETGMLVEARSAHGIDLRGSYVVGDRDSDMLLARAVGAKGILIRNGALETSEHADAVADTLEDAVRLIR